MTRVVKRLNTAVKSYGLAPPKLIIEPGRSLVGQAGLTLYTVGTIKKEPGSPSQIPGRIGSGRYYVWRRSVPG